MINSILDDKLTAWEEKIDTYQSPTIFKEEPVAREMEY